MKNRIEDNLAWNGGGGHWFHTTLSSGALIGLVERCSKRVYVSYNRTRTFHCVHHSARFFTPCKISLPSSKRLPQQHRRQTWKMLLFTNISVDRAVILNINTTANINSCDIAQVQVLITPWGKPDDVFILFIKWHVANKTNLYNQIITEPTS